MSCCLRVYLNVHFISIILRNSLTERKPFYRFRFERISVLSSYYNCKRYNVIIASNEAYLYMRPNSGTSDPDADQKRMQHFT